MGKRSNGEGNVYQRANGTWEARMTYPDPDTGRQRRASFYAPTKRAVMAKMKAARERVDAGAPVKDASTTVADWLAHWRATTLAASDRKETTRSLYTTLSKVHLEPAPFGATPLDKLRPSDVEALVLRLRAKTKPGRPDPDSDAEPAPVRALSDSTIRSTYTVLRAALDGAVRDGLLARNPAAQVRRPGVERTEARHLDAEDVTAVLRAAESSRYHPALVLIASTGMRKGEALALAWDALDLDAGMLRVAATISRVGGRLVITEPKTVRSRRTVPLNPAVVSMLRKHKARQAAERLRAANQWQNSGLVFTTELGGPVDPRNLLRVVEVASRSANIEKVGAHTFRHSAAVAWLESGVHIKAVADLLGHSSIAITGDVYGHTSDDTARAAIDGLAGRLGLLDVGGHP
ncbi:phage integrase family protein [Mycolicibacterium aurum]|uniref:Phage integrase family protein n=1 Tax=Mycolicibacterium aurum TaxID=1791 RepID=A0A3S5EJJ9_MYCAU|nr:site-specific integrase [Mycolicibacterium aurum]VEG55662.1 phage integrase family protein [Mycolicibacterium aurum]